MTDLLIGLAIIALGLAIVAGAIFFWPRGDRPPRAFTLQGVQQELGLERWPTGLFATVGVIWLVILVALVLGLLSMIVFLAPVALDARTGGDDAQSLFRLSLIAIATLSATSGAVVAVPLTLYRAELTRRQTENAALTLFNEKINAATEGLHAMRQNTERDAGGAAVTIWEPDITRRNAAIDALHGLAEERPAETARIARMLSVYVRELSREVPPEPVPDDKSPDDLRAWADTLKPKRSDMEKAVQTLGRLRKIDPGLAASDIDLTGANLQGMDLKGLDFTKATLTRTQMQRAVLRGAQMQGADLFAAQMQGADLFAAQMQGADLSGAQMQGADLGWAQMQGADLSGAQMQGAHLSKAQMSDDDKSRRR